MDPKFFPSFGRLLTTRNIAIIAVAAFCWSLDHGLAFGAEGTNASEIQGALLGLALILLAAKLGGDLLERVGQPAVLGELAFGILLGNLNIFGWEFAESFKTSVPLEALAELGVIVLLFDVGLRSSVAEMKSVGLRALLVATAGVIVPFALGWGISSALMPNASVYKHIFIGAALCATSVAITARVLKDIGRGNSREAKIILGAAVIDDVMGLVILAVVVGLIDTANSGGALSASGIGLVCLKAVGFVVITISAGSPITQRLFAAASRIHGTGILLTAALILCFTLSWLADQMGLAAIVGAFCAGLLIDEKFYAHKEKLGKQKLPELMTPLVAFLAPVFFVRMGMLVDVSVFANGASVGLAVALTVAAIVGKQVCGLFAGSGVNRWAVGLGMIPRGEVGLIFAGIGAKLFLDGSALVSADAYNAVVIMVVVTTLVTPPLLKWSLRRSPGSVD